MTPRPLLTFAVITYRQEEYAAQAAQGALSQTYAPLEIILSDDCSPDDTFDVLRRAAEAYRGPNRVTVRRTERNLGLIGHLNDIMRLAQGELLIIAAGDDISLPQRAERVYETWRQSGGRAHSIFSNAIWIDETGRPLNPLHKTPILPEELTLSAYAARRVPSLVNGATHAWTRDLFDHFGPLPLEARAEDILLPFRAALLGEIRYIYEPLVLYRRDSGRLRDAQGRSSLAQHRQRWAGWQEMHAAVYRARLRDLQTCLQNGLSPHPPAELEAVRHITAQRLAQLEELLAARGSDTRLPPLRRLALRARIFFDPLFDFLRLNLYYRYQDLRRKQ
ncbi:MAG: glycosyltransferase [Anaerolineales bacterium]|nr:glycosyltransferase [Anaerolineales bacterium]MCX7756401.1 glycosyltransferase [Anaerolineales bacterium]MDW8278730.1 glycosyltransferase [Anaerolineales bacterium]